MSLGSPTNTLQHWVRRAQIRWPKKLEMSDNSTPDQDRQPQQLPGDKPNQHKFQGKALQVNENSVEDQVPARPPALPRRGSRGKRTQQKLQGKALQVNKNSAED
jgi:hypothetical protein